MTMEIKEVVSSNIRSIGYDPDREVMTVEFTGGSRYEYDHVPGHVYTEFVNAESHGGHFHANIRPSFPGRRIKGL